MIRMALAATTGGIVMVAGYFGVETLLYGWQPALLAAWANGLQALSGAIVGTGATFLLKRGLSPGRA